IYLPQLKLYARSAVNVPPNIRNIASPVASARERVTALSANVKKARFSKKKALWIRTECRSL
ncbi:MAG TPA: hypothetical protein VHO66_09545, partial [Ruminiclostridium sp.]|nr:hypothetical protein [Ruminiclostridium sp.]